MVGLPVGRLGDLPAVLIHTAVGLYGKKTRRAKTWKRDLTLFTVVPKLYAANEGFSYGNSKAEILNHIILIVRRKK